MKNRIQIVDLVRTVSILTVIAIHLGCHYITLPSHPYFLAYIWYRIWINGGYGVTMFFVISGFVITRLIANSPGGLFQPDYRDFYVRRVGRILPLLTWTCSIGIVMLLLAPASGRAYEYCFRNPKACFSPLTWISIATFSFNWYKISIDHITHALGLHWDMLWSLSIEEQFYFFYPFLLKRLKDETRLYWFLALVIAFSPFSPIVVQHFLPAVILVHYNSFLGFGQIATGCLLYLVSRRYEKHLIKNPKISFYLLAAGLFLLLKTYLRQDYKADYWGHFFGPLFIGFGVFLFLLGGLHLDFFESKFWSLLGFPGKLSYGGYLYHAASLYFLWPLLTGLNEFLAYFILVTVNTTVAWISFDFFEMPVNQWIRKTLGRASPKGA